jgi:hypothetical protein
VTRNFALIVGLFAIALFWSAIGFPFALGALIMLLRHTGPSALPFVAAMLALTGFAASFYLLRRWTR